MLRALKQKLIDLGLSDKETSVFLVLIQGGEMTAEQVATVTKLNRSTTYVQLKLLMDRGLASTFKRGKKTFFAAESPSNLVRLVEQKRESILKQEVEIKSIVADLLKVFGNVVDRPTVRVFEGKEGLVTMRNSMLETDAGTILVAASFDAMAKIFNDEELMDFSRRRSASKKQSVVLYTKTGEDVQTVPPQKILRVDQKKFPFGADVYIYGDTVSFASTKNQIVGVTIKNADIAMTMKALFDSAEKVAEQFKAGKEVKK